MIELRPYQEDALERIRESYKSGHNAPCYVAPPGAGKTRIFARICAGVAEKNNRLLILAHRVELVDQISQALSDEGCEHSYLAAGYPYLADSQVHVSSVFTLAHRLDSIAQPDLIIVDECHHAIPRSSWGKVLSAFPSARRLGVTASPQRLSGESLADLFDDLILGPAYEELITQGFLTPCRVYAPATIDTTGLHVRAGDYVPSELCARIDRPQITGDCIEHYRRLTPHARAVVFDVSVEAARKRAEAFRQAGFSSECIDGETPRDVRALAVADFRAGRIEVLTSCNLVSEGFDLPAIEVGISLRPTRSLALWLQQSGRVLRPFPGKERAILFDHAGNCFEHGLPTETRAWSLAGVDPLFKRAQYRSGLRTCPTCFAVSKVSAVVCQSCGATFKVEPRKIDEVKGDLSELTAQDLIRARRKDEQWRAGTLEALVELGKRRGMATPKAWGWAKHVMAARQRKRRIG